jgi:hypothetical protein
MSVKVVHAKHHRGANHEDWRALFKETTGYVAGGNADTRAFRDTVPFINPEMGKVPGSKAIPDAIRWYLDGPSASIQKFRQCLVWADCWVTRWHRIITTTFRRT